MFQIWLQCHLHVFRTMPWVGMLDPSNYEERYAAGRHDLCALVVLFKIASIATQDTIRNEGAHLLSNISTVSANGISVDDICQRQSNGTSQKANQYMLTGVCIFKLYVKVPTGPTPPIDGVQRHHWPRPPTDEDTPVIKETPCLH